MVEQLSASLTTMGRASGGSPSDELLDDLVAGVPPKSPCWS
jgi:hypothetical protein